MTGVIALLLFIALDGALFGVALHWLSGPMPISEDGLTRVAGEASE